MVPFDDDQSMAEVAVVKSTSIATTMRARFIGQGYKQVCGQADMWGDGVVPEVSAHLEGALNISLEGVYHSPVGSDDTLRPWAPDDLLDDEQSVAEPNDVSLELFAALS
ncbi:hypothetical protein HHK36_028345 [Tetracentron sinense]|uniref:Uncharacterized protein n=1 Tax=Tetracentron sinense TaxID=13715 RepID=A0A834YKX5_TETSI|nr:hypothetical protein HHK36_028345 [Tetracentron sinense]